MFRRKILPLCVLLSSFALIAGGFALRAQDDDSHHGRKYKAPPLSSTISVSVVRAYNGKPISGAHVIFHPIEGDKDKGALELKTNDDGKVSITVIPLGDTVTLQVIANGFQTYGQIYKIDQLNMTMEVRMNRPTSQYSTYKNSSENSGSNGSGSANKSSSGDDSSSGKSSGSAPNTPPPDSSKQSDPPSNQNQSQPPPK